MVRSVSRAKWLAASGLLIIAAVFAPLAAFVSRGVVVPAFVLLAVWYFWFLPSHRKRVRRIYASLPRWEIEETPSARMVSGSRCEPMGAPVVARERDHEQRDGTL